MILPKIIYQVDAFTSEPFKGNPVTGSAHCALVPFWHMKTGRNEFVSHQVSKRSGILRVALKGDRVEIAGHAKTILKAELFV